MSEDIAQPCPRCRGTGTWLVKQVFKDGSVHLREECAGCKKFVRYVTQQARQPLPVVESAPENPQPPVDIDVTPGREKLPQVTFSLPSGENHFSPSVGESADLDVQPGAVADLSQARKRAVISFDTLRERARSINTVLHDPTIDHPLLAAVFGSLLAASASLSPEHYLPRADRIRRKEFP
jgi:hypothetical protein